jgi:hypothetical protein
MTPYRNGKGGAFGSMVSIRPADPRDHRDDASDRDRIRACLLSAAIGAIVWSLVILVIVRA